MEEQKRRVRQVRVKRPMCPEQFSKFQSLKVDDSAQHFFKNSREVHDLLEQEEEAENSKMIIEALTMDPNNNEIIPRQLQHRVSAPIAGHHNDTE